MRVGTFNICHGQGRDRKVDLRRTAEVIRGLDVDLIALQELDVGLRRSKKVDQPAELADLLGMHVYFSPTLRFEGGEYGIALAAREEFRGAAEFLPSVGDEEPRAAIVASWKRIGIVATHLSRDGVARKLQTEEIAEQVGKLGTPAIILGDLNQPLKDLAPLRAKGFTPVTPARSLLSRARVSHQIDHVLVSEGVKVSAPRRVSTDVSDHSPFGVDIAIK